MQTILLTTRDLNSDSDALAGRYLDAEHYDRVIENDTTVLKPDGTPLLVYAQDALPRSLCNVAFAAFKNRRLTSDNRAMGRKRTRRIKQDGSRSRTTHTDTVNTGIIGYFDRVSRIPYCRMTAFNLDHPTAFNSIRPFIKAVSRQFRALARDRWEAQRAFVEGVSDDFVIRDSVFTTVTVNKSFRTPAHRDEGDYRPGFGVMTVLEGGHFGGCELIFPKYRTAVDMRTGGLLLADVHELHGNAPLVVRAPNQRIAFVFYAREKMRLCGSAAEELARAKGLADR